MTLGLAQRIEAGENLTLDVPEQGSGVIASTILSFGLSSETPIQSLSLDATTALRWSDLPDRGNEFDIGDSIFDFGYNRDGAESSISVLPRIVDAVGDHIEVHMDGGIRSGQDVLKARALGARGTYIGRAFLYGLGAMGEAGVTKALEIIHRELDLTMAFTGRTHIDDVNGDVLVGTPFR